MIKKQIGPIFEEAAGIWSKENKDRKDVIWGNFDADRNEQTFHEKVINYPTIRLFGKLNKKYPTRYSDDPKESDTEKNFNARNIVNWINTQLDKEDQAVNSNRKEIDL